jgi:hypothetical protein
MAALELVGFTLLFILVSVYVGGGLEVGVFALLLIIALVGGAYINADPVLLYIQIGSLYVLIQAIYHSQQRWRSVGYAVLAQVSFVLVYFVLVRILASVISMSPAAINKTLDSLGWVALYPGAVGAWIPPRRKSARQK